MNIYGLLKEYFGSDNVKELNNVFAVPFYLKSLYKIVCLSIYGNKVLVLDVVDDSTFNLYDYRKNKNEIEKLSNLNSILYIKNMNTHQKEAMIKNNYMFITSNGQFFLPNFGININKERNDKYKIGYTIQTQLCAIYMFYHFNDDMDVEQIKKDLKLNDMAVSRAMSYLKENNFVERKKEGKNNIYSIKGDRSSFYNKLKEVLINPVQKEINSIEENNNQFVFAGCTALSEYTLINDNSFKTYAVYKKETITETKALDHFSKVEIWKYDPLLFSKNNLVDPISLIASFKEENIDERILKEIQTLEVDIKDDKY